MRRHRNELTLEFVKLFFTGERPFGFQRPQHQLMCCLVYAVLEIGLVSEQLLLHFPSFGDLGALLPHPSDGKDEHTNQQDERRNDSLVNLQIFMRHTKFVQLLKCIVLGGNQVGDNPEYANDNEVFRDC